MLHVELQHLLLELIVHLLSTYAGSHFLTIGRRELLVLVLQAVHIGLYSGKLASEVHDLGVSVMDDLVHLAAQCCVFLCQAFTKELLVYAGLESARLADEVSKHTSLVLLDSYRKLGPVQHIPVVHRVSVETGDSR